MLNLKLCFLSISVKFLNFFLGLLGKNFKNVIIQNLNLSQQNRDLEVKIFCPEYIKSDPSEKKLIERILAAYKHAKQIQEKAPTVFLPSLLWQNQLEISYKSLMTFNIEEFHHFLTNFGAWQHYTGIEHCLHDIQKSSYSTRNFEHSMASSISWWLLHHSKGRDISVLTQPRFGNIAGTLINGTFVSLGAAFNDMRAENIASIAQISNEQCPIIAEVGGGYGKLTYAISKCLKNFKYIDFDLPETLCCATYYLMKCFPNKKFLLFGEGELSQDTISNYDFILMPSFCIESLPTDSVDVFINLNSLGEMSPETTTKFVSEITRTSKYFWHMNHEFIRNDFTPTSSSLINCEYGLPNDQFRQVVRYQDIGHAIYKGNFDLNSDIYCYVYKNNRDNRL
jgi:putative sugar O-methyltransferase